MAKTCQKIVYVLLFWYYLYRDLILSNVSFHETGNMAFDILEVDLLYMRCVSNIKADCKESIMSYKICVSIYEYVKVYTISVSLLLLAFFSMFLHIHVMLKMCQDIIKKTIHYYTSKWFGQKLMIFHFYEINEMACRKVLYLIRLGIWSN